jgi:hypothetical protein
VYFLGHTLLPAAYPEHPSVAQAIEDSLRTDPHAYMDSELSALARADHGPAMKDALLQSLTSGSFPHWAARALAMRWGDDEEARAALRAVLEGEPVRASYAAAAAVPVLGREAAVERLLELLALPRNGQRRVRADIIAVALADIYRDEAGTPGADAERVAAACLEQLPHPGDEYESTAEGEIIAAMGATRAARDRARSMLARPQIPLATLAAGYARDPEALRPVLRRLHEIFPSLPAQPRAYLCTLLRESTADRPLARDLTRQWADDPDDQVAVAASAAFHAHLRHDHDGGTLQPGEWEEALAAIRREAVKRSFRRWGHQRGAWTGALLLDRLGALDDLSDGQVPARLNLGDTLGPADMTLLSAIADGWPALRAHFGDQLLTRLSEDPQFNHAWHRHHALNAAHGHRISPSCLAMTPEAKSAVSSVTRKQATGKASPARSVISASALPGRPPGKPAGQRANAGKCTLTSAANVKPHTHPPQTLSVAGPSPRTLSVARPSPRGTLSVAVRAQPTVPHTAPWPRFPSAMRPWTPQRNGLQRDKVTHHGTEKKRPASARIRS